jgi:hypothetical protein
MNKWPFLLCVALCSCAGNDVSYVPQTSSAYAPVPPKTVMVADRPPKGEYVTLGILTAEQHLGENTEQGINRFREKAAAIGADYVWIVSLGSNQYIAPAVSNTFSGASANATGQGYVDAYGNYSGTANVDSYGNAMTISTPSHPYSLLVATGKALRITSGSHDPDMTKDASVGNPKGL